MTTTLPMNAIPHVTVAIKNGPPYISCDVTSKGEVVNPSGSDYEIVKLLSKHLNFTYSLLYPEDDQWGVLQPNGSWSGVISLLQQQMADLGLAGLSTTADRLTVVDFSNTYDHDPIVFVIRAEEPPNQLYTYFKDPFQDQVWISLLLIVALYAVIFKIYCSFDKRHNYYGQSTIFTLTRIILKQDNSPRFYSENSRRILILPWILGFYFVTVFFESTLTATASSGSRRSQLDTVDKMAVAVKKGLYTISSMKGDILTDIFMTSEEEFLSGLNRGRRLALSEVPADIESGLRRVVEVRNYAFAVQLALADVASRKIGLQHRLLYSKDFLLEDKLAVAFRKGFPYTALFAYQIDRLKEAGIISNIRKNWLLQNSKSEFKITSSKIMIDMQEIRFLFYLLISGGILSLLGFIFELCRKFLL